jgi:hypothetical protein
MICPRIWPSVLRLLAGSRSQNRVSLAVGISFFGSAAFFRRWTWVSSLSQLASLLTPACQLQQRRYSNPRQLC